MAKVFLLSLEEVFEEEVEEEEEEEESSSQSEIDFEEETLDHAALWSSSVFDEETLISPTPPIFMPSDYEDQITLSLDLFDRCPPPETLDTSDFGALDGIDPAATDDGGLGLGLGFDDHRPEEEEEDGLMDNGDGFPAVDWAGSDSEPIVDPHYPSWQLRWEDRRDLDYEDLEWEEIDGRVGERETVGERWRRSELDDEDGDLEDEEGGDVELSNVDWEVLLAVNNLVMEEEDFGNPSEYEVLFEQFADYDSAIRGTPPAAKSVVDNLPSIVLTQEDVAKNNTICAVCKDDISLEEKVKQLPCLHHYHGECILPWLGMRNTCPVCRYELPTDNPEYERWKAQRRASNEGRYDLEMFSEGLL